MKLYLDTSDVVVVKALSRIFPLTGVTTNPGIIITGRKSLGIVLSQLHETMGGQGRLFAQIMAITAEGMVNNALKLCFIIADIVTKTPMTAEGLAAVKMLKAEGIPMLGTAIYGAAQGLLLTLAGAECATPYVNRIDAQGSSGIQTVTDLHQLLKMHAPQMKALATSFKALCRALDCLLAGCESATLPLDMAQQMISYPTVDAAVVRLGQDWQGVFGRTSV